MAADERGVPRAIAAPESYWRASRAHRYSLLFALPLLALYEGLAAALSHQPGGGIRNGADVLLRSAFLAIGGRYGPLLFGATLLGAGIWLIGRDMRARGGKLEVSVFARMFAESVLLALALGVVVGGLTAGLLGGAGAVALAPVEELGWWSRLMVSLGAGLYEELVFRVILVGGLAYAARTVLAAHPAAAGAIAAVIGAFIFSAFHYIGPYGDPLALSSFVFRFIAGLAFSGLFLLRGFGITAWTHALYDVFLLAL